MKSPNHRPIWIVPILLILCASQRMPAQPAPAATRPQAMTDSALNDRLEHILVDADYDRMDLSKIIDDLRQRFTLNIHVNWSALEGSDVKRDTRVEVHLKQVPLATLLDFILVEASGGEMKLAYQVRGGVVFISTADALSRQTVVRTYDLTDLLGSAYGMRRFANTPILRLERAGGEATGGQPSTAPGDGGGGFGQGGGGAKGNVFGGGGGIYGGAGEEEAIEAEFVSIESVIELIRSVVAPETWREAGGNVGSVRPLENRLIVTQTVTAQREIETLLATLRRTSPVPMDGDAMIIRVPAAGVARWRESAGRRFPRLSEEQVRASTQDPAAQIVFRGTTTGRNGQRLWFSSLTQRYVRAGGMPVVGDGIWTLQHIPAAVNEGLELIVLPMLAPDDTSMSLDVQMGWALPAGVQERQITVGSGPMRTGPGETGRTVPSEAATGMIDLVTRRMRTVSTMVALKPGESIALSIPGELDAAPAEKRTEDWLILDVRKATSAK